MKIDKTVQVESFVNTMEKDERVMCGSRKNFEKCLKKGTATNFRKQKVDITFLQDVFIEEMKNVPKNRFAHVINNKVVQAYII